MLTGNGGKAPAPRRPPAPNVDPARHPQSAMNGVEWTDVIKPVKLRAEPSATWWCYSCKCTRSVSPEIHQEANHETEDRAAVDSGASYHRRQPTHLNGHGGCQNQPTEEAECGRS